MKDKVMKYVVIGLSEKDLRFLHSNITKHILSVLSDEEFIKQVSISPCTPTR